MDFYKYFPLQRTCDANASQETEKIYLEIGPLDNPFLKRDNYNVRYLDYHSTDEIKTLYRNTYANLDKIVNIDYATHGRTYSETVGQTKFDAVYSSHCIEHCHDIIGHFQDVADVLKDGGYYVFVAPDKKCCFDYFREQTTFREAYCVHKTHQLHGQIADKILNSSKFFTSEDCRYFYEKRISLIDNLIQNNIGNMRTEQAVKIWNNNDPLEIPPDYHLWTFTNESLFSLLRDCLRFNLFPFELDYHECTTDDTNYNIYVALRKNERLLKDSNLRLKEIIKIQCLSESRQGIKSSWHQIFSNIPTKTLYIYGAGKVGLEWYRLIRDLTKAKIEFVVSDDVPCPQYALPEPCRHLSEITLSDDVFFAIAVRDIKMFKEIKQNLMKAGFGYIKHFVRV